MPYLKLQTMRAVPYPHSSSPSSPENSTTSAIPWHKGEQSQLCILCSGEEARQEAVLASFALLGLWSAFTVVWVL